MAPSARCSPIEVIDVVRGVRTEVDVPGREQELHHTRLLAAASHALYCPEPVARPPDASLGVGVPGCDPERVVIRIRKHPVDVTDLAKPVNRGPSGALIAACPDVHGRPLRIGTILAVVDDVAIGADAERTRTTQGSHACAAPVRTDPEDAAVAEDHEVAVAQRYHVVDGGTPETTPQPARRLEPRRRRQWQPRERRPRPSAIACAVDHAAARGVAAGTVQVVQDPVERCQRSTRQRRQILRRFLPFLGFETHLASQLIPMPVLRPLEPRMIGPVVQQRRPVPSRRRGVCGLAFLLKVPRSWIRASAA